jgi:hypothetical protein
MLHWAANSWQSWIVGFFAWTVLIGLIGAFIYWITKGGWINIRKSIPDAAFDYFYRSPILPENGFFLDTHSHTWASDGWMTAEQNIRWHIANGFHAMVLTDHNTDANNSPSLALQAKYPQIVIIPGFEWTAPRIHLNFIGIEKWPHKVPFKPTDEEIKTAIHQAKAMGALVQVNHIPWTLDQPYVRSGESVHPTRDQLLEWGVDGFEVQNEIRWYDPRTIAWLEQKKLRGELRRPIYLSSGTDIHNPIKEWVQGWTELLLTPEEGVQPTIDIVKTALREGRTKIWADYDYRRPYEAKFDPQSKLKWFHKVFAPAYAIMHGVSAIPGGFKGAWIYILWGLFVYFPFRLFFMWLVN